MELAVIHSRALAGVDAPLVCVEAHLSNGLPAFNIVGLPETAVRESRDRVRSALLNSHLDFPDRRITVNLAPADLPKEGGRFDLPIALAILSASGQVVPERLADHEFLGELALDGSLRPVPGVVAGAGAAASAGRCLVVSPCCARAAAHAPGSRVLPASDLLTLCAHLNGSVPLKQAKPSSTSAVRHCPDLAEMVGQESARRALEIAAAGGHHILLQGPPGTGKTLLASCLSGILPPVEPGDALVAMMLRDTQGLPLDVDGRPFRSPHHSASAAALVGGGSRPRPGEISLAHGGVLFLDELPEFNRQALDMLREPLECGHITLSRARHTTTYPARFQLVAAMNPCPCGYLGDPERACRCGLEQVRRYRGRVSGPLLDRIDLHVNVQRLPARSLLQPHAAAESSAVVRARVCEVRNIQAARQAGTNAAIAPDRLLALCGLDGEGQAMLEEAGQRLGLSGRALHRTLRVSRTIADMAGAASVAAAHVAEALGYRPG